jgi:MoxR-like ATPase
LQAAVEVARALGMPLLVTGEPGTGKTQLAYWVAQLIRAEEANARGEKPLDEKQDPRVLRFNTKTTSVARDLFYRFDAVRHFRATHQKPGEPANIFDFLTFEALGKAILAAGRRQFVVLVDEIDKAPRDFPNDVLFEFEELAFRVEEAVAEDFEGYKGRFGQKPEFRELNVAVQDPEHKQGVISLQQDAPRPVLILTSNSEKNLPDAFLRRCIFYHISFPEKDDLIEIVKKNAQISSELQEDLIAQAAKDFEATPPDRHAQTTVHGRTDPLGGNPR